MTFKPALVALDIDGTIVSAGGELPGEVRDAVRRVVAAGVPVVLTTGRAWAGTQVVFDALGLPPGPSVCANGAMIVNYPPIDVVHEIRFDPADSINRVARLAPNAAIAVTDGMKWRVSKPFPDGELKGEIIVESLGELASRPVSRIVVRDPESDDDVFNEMVEALGLREVSYYIGWSSWVDIVPEGVDKARGLEQVCGQFGVTAADVLVLGDGYNDIEMIRWAGRGVAMGDAPHDVRAAADHVTGDFGSGGAIQELARWFPAESKAG